MVNHCRYLAAERDTLALGAELAHYVRSGMVIHLSGSLGAGKTTLVRGLLRGLGWQDRVKSPTFTLVEPYAVSSLYLYHFDFYRFDHSDEWENTGFREYFSPTSICLVEWPEKAGSNLSVPDLRIELASIGSGRNVVISAHTKAGGDCLTHLQN